MSEYELKEPYKHTTNQLINQFAYNKSLIDLFNNDLYLQELFDSIYNGEQKGIQAYNKNTIYKKGELIWYKADNWQGVPTLYLLESVIDENHNVPKLTFEDNQYTFEKSGWKDKNEYNTFLNSDVKAYVAMLFNKNIDALHGFDTNYHRFGKLETNDDANAKIMANNVLNVDPGRKQVFYPTQTLPLEQDNAIIMGQCRKWDNGLLEYDIVFKLGCDGSTTYIRGAQYEVVECNNLSIDGESDSLKYFMSEDDCTMFNTTGSNVAIIEDMAQTNKTGYCDSYSAKLHFPIEFVDQNYMIFGSGVRSVERDTGKQSIDCNLNTITYINKTKKSVDAVYVVAPSINAKKGSQNGLVSNCFHCQVVGKWK